MAITGTLTLYTEGGGALSNPVAAPAYSKYIASLLITNTGSNAVTLLRIEPALSTRAFADDSGNATLLLAAGNYEAPQGTTTPLFQSPPQTEAVKRQANASTLPTIAGSSGTLTVTWPLTLFVPSSSGVTVAYVIYTSDQSAQTDAVATKSSTTTLN